MREAVGKVTPISPAIRRSPMQIHRFIVLHKELDADDDELTRTRKVRRRFISKFDQLVDAMYGGLNEQYVETAVRFEDGRTGKISATLKVIDAEVFPALRRRRRHERAYRRGHRLSGGRRGTWRVGHCLNGQLLFAVVGFALIFTFLYLVIEAANKAGKPKHEIKRAANSAWSMKDDERPNNESEGRQ